MTEQPEQPDSKEGLVVVALMLIGVACVGGFLGYRHLNKPKPAVEAPVAAVGHVWWSDGKESPFVVGVRPIKAMGGKRVILGLRDDGVTVWKAE